MIVWAKQGCLGCSLKFRIIRKEKSPPSDGLCFFVAFKKQHFYKPNIKPLFETLPHFTTK